MRANSEEVSPTVINRAHSQETVGRISALGTFQSLVEKERDSTQRPAPGHPPPEEKR